MVYINRTHKPQFGWAQHFVKLSLHLFCFRTLLEFFLNKYRWGFVQQCDQKSWSCWTERNEWWSNIGHQLKNNVIWTFGWFDLHGTDYTSASGCKILELSAVIIKSHQMAVLHDIECPKILQTNTLIIICIVSIVCDKLYQFIVMFDTFLNTANDHQISFRQNTVRHNKLQ